MIRFHIPTMTCGHCAAAVTEALQRVDSGAQVKTDVASKSVELTGSSAPAEDFEAALSQAGYSPHPAEVS